MYFVALGFQERGVFDGSTETIIESDDKELIWTVDSVLTECNDALDALYDCIHKKKQNRKKWGSYADHSGWADLRMIGAFVPFGNEKCNTNKVDVCGELPNFVFSGINHRKENDTERNKYMFLIAHRLTNLPIGFYSTGTGYAYEITCAYIFNDGSSCEVSYFVTICPDTGEISMTNYKNMGVKSVRNKRTNQKTSIPVSEVISCDPFISMREFDISTHFDGIQTVAMGFNLYLHQHLNLIVSASDKRGRVNIVVPLEQSKYIFKDRNKVVTKNGRTRPICHWVISHQRINGSYVRTHMRGLKNFKWLGMDINIKMPGKDSNVLHTLKTIVQVKGDVVWNKLFSKQKKINIVNQSSKEKVKIYVVDNDNDLVGHLYD